MAWFAFLSPLIDHFGKMGNAYLARKRVEAEGKVKVAIARAEAEATVAVKKLEAETEWERTMADGSRYSWKDEWWTIVLSVPLLLCFVPPAIPYLEDGFNILSQLPEWYGIAVGLAISAAFGKNVVSHFTNMKK